jgi:RNA polymerase sigma-70 factor (ECF subfamily)
VFSLNPTFVNVEAPQTPSLLDAARAGDARAFGELCRVYETRLLRHALTLCGNESAAAELAEDTLVEAWHGLARFNGRCRFFTWLCAILLNRHRNVLRKKRPLPAAMLAGPDRERFEDRIANAPDHGLLPDQAAQARERAAVVWNCLQSLPRKQQQVIYLRFYADDSLEGIADALGISVGTVKSRLYHGLDRLRGMDALTPQLAPANTTGGMS